MKKKMKVFIRRKVGAMARTDASVEEFHNRLASGLKKAEDLLNARAAQIWKAEQSKVSHDVHKGKFRIALSVRFSAEKGDFELKLQLVSSGSHGIPAKTMDSATMGKVVRIIKSSLEASSINASPLRISSVGTGGAPTIGFLTLKGKVSVERGDGERGCVRSRTDIDRTALKQRIEKRLRVCKEIVELWGSREGGFRSSNDKDQIEADLEAIDRAEKFIARAQEVLKKLK